MNKPVITFEVDRQRMTNEELQNAIKPNIILEICIILGLFACGFVIASAMVN